MNHQDKHLSSQIWEFLLNEIDPAQAREIEEHLESCPSCHEEFLDSQKLLTNLQSIHPDEASDLFFDRQFQQIQSQLGPKPTLKWVAWLKPALAVAAVVGFFVMGGTLFKSINFLPFSPYPDQTMLEGPSVPNEINIEELELPQLNQLSENLEKNLYQNLPMRDFIGEEGNLEDLNDRELDQLIYQLETAEFRRKS